MKRGNLKSFLLGVLVCALVFGIGVPALASSTTKTAELYYNDIKIRLNGAELTPKDADGNIVEPFIIDGTTYLPVRAVGNALGLNVGWDGATKTVILGNDPEYNRPAAWLGELEPFEGDPHETVVVNNQYDNYTTANNGETFDRSFYNEIKNGYGVSYLQKGQYKHFTGTFYLTKDDKDTNTQYRLLAYSDDTLIYTSPIVTKGVEPIPFNIDISDCYKLELVCQYYRTNEDRWDNTQIYSRNLRIGNAALWTD